MLPPNLRGYAPDISGVAHTAAKVTVSQAGRIIYETQVPAGPFRIQDLGEFNSGTLHVRIEELNGQVQEYDISTASMPFLTRPGQVRYKVMMGRPQEWGHHVQGGFFSGGEASWGIANGWSLYGGALGDETTSLPRLASGAISPFSARWRLILPIHIPGLTIQPLTARAHSTVTLSASVTPKTLMI